PGIPHGAGLARLARGTGTSDRTSSDEHTLRLPKPVRAVIWQMPARGLHRRRMRRDSAWASTASVQRRHWPRCWSSSSWRSRSWHSAGSASRGRTAPGATDVHPRLPDCLTDSEHVPFAVAEPGAPLATRTLGRIVAADVGDPADGLQPRQVDVLEDDATLLQGGNRRLDVIDLPGHLR